MTSIGSLVYFLYSMYNASALAACVFMSHNIVRSIVLSIRVAQKIRHIKMGVTLKINIYTSIQDMNMKIGRYRDIYMRNIHMKFGKYSINTIYFI